MGIPKISKFVFKFNHEKVFSFMCNYLYNLESYKDIKPMRLYAYPSARCNDRCSYCAEYTKYDPRIDFFSERGSIDKLLRDVTDIGFKDIHLFGGGEPFFYKDNMFYFLEKMADTDAFIRVISNGINLSVDDIKNFVKNKLISQLNITVNTDSQDLASKFYANKKRHAHTLSILENISKYKKLYNTRFPLIDIMFVLSNLNYNRVLNIISMLKEFDINYFFIQPLRIDCEEHKKFELSEIQLAEFSKLLPEIEERLMEGNTIRSNINDFKINKNFIDDSRNHKSVIQNKILFGRNTKLGCYFPLTTFSILSDCSIPKCYFLLHFPHNKNYLSLLSLREFFKSKDYIEFVQGFVGNNCLSNCNNCSICILYEIEEIRKNFSYFGGSRQESVASQ